MSSQARILLVDDEAAIIDNLAPFLERSGFEVLTANNGEEAIDQIENQSPDWRQWFEPDPIALREIGEVLMFHYLQLGEAQRDQDGHCQDHDGRGNCPRQEQAFLCPVVL